MNNEKNINNKPNQNKYKNLTPFKNWVLTNFPFIEADFDALTNYEFMSKLGGHLNEVISNQNMVEEDVTNLFNAYQELENYVNNYFNNLDLTDKINDKLDALAKDGTLTNLIANYMIPIINQQNNQIAEIETKVNNVVSGDPLIADSVANMTNTSRIYVNTSDGNWYYYNGSEWVIGGVYQAEKLANNSVFYRNLSNELQQQLKALYGTIGVINTEGASYNGNVGSKGSITQRTGYSIGTLDVEEDDVINIPFVNTYIQYGVIPAIVIVDENEIVLQKYEMSYFIEDSRPKNTNIIMPANAKKLYFNNRFQDSTYGPFGTLWYPIKITSYNYNDSRLQQLLNNDVEIEPTTILNNKIYGMAVSDFNSSVYQTYVYDVEPLELMHIQHLITTPAYLANALFTNDDYNVVGFIPPFGTNPGTQFDGDIEVPSFATKMLITVSKSQLQPQVYKKVVGVDISSKKKLSVNYVNGILSITNNDNNNNITFRNFGANNLFMISSYNISGSNKVLSTDMIPAPYIVNAVNNPNGDRTSQGFTGGNHGYNNLGSGSTPTAKQVSLQIYVDGLIFNNGNKNGNHVQIVEVNRIQANNTCLSAGGGRNVLEERICYDFDGYDLYVTNIITPLEEIIITRYYGFAMAGFTNNQYEIYADKVYNVNTQNQVKNKPYAIYGDKMLKMEMFNAGLGDYAYNTSSIKVNISNNKAYFVPIYGDSIFTTDDVLYISGVYRFQNNQI